MMMIMIAIIIIIIIIRCGFIAAFFSPHSLRLMPELLHL